MDCNSTGLTIRTCIKTMPDDSKYKKDSHPVRSPLNALSQQELAQMRASIRNRLFYNERQRFNDD